MLPILHPIQLPEPLDAELAAGFEHEPPIILMRSALAGHARHASRAQLGRLHHEACALWLAYCQAASWNLTRTMPTVADYLAHRYSNTFLPIVTPLDTLGGWELPAELYYQPELRRVTLLAGAQTCIANDLCSLAHEAEQPSGWDVSLPLAIAANHDCPLEQSVDIAVDVHNTTMVLFETVEQNLLATFGEASPVRRWLAGLRNWMSGNLQFHLTSPRYLGTSELLGDTR